MIKPGNIWHSPVNVYWHLQRLTESVGSKAVEKDRACQLAREARVGAVVALAMFRRMGKPTYLQLYRPDPPDLILMQQSKSGQRDITQVEITRYIGSPRETLFEQLRRKKVPPGINIYSDNYILVVNVGIGLDVEYESLRDYLNENKTPFPIWTIQEQSSYPDTIAKLVIVNPKIYELVINIGEAAAVFDKLKLPGVIHSTQKVVNPKLVRADYVGKNYEAPWDTVGK